ncbi:MAG: M64 family metallopeptidase [Actinomycetota bacterium]|nr:M64 family metallopeptidase [Actinomycetota bacterium]
MGDGTVSPPVLIADRGPRTQRLNLVLTGDGYTAADQPFWREDATNLVRMIERDLPFIFRAMNVFRLDVASAESGSDQPASCGPVAHPTGAARLVNTYYDGAYCVTDNGRADINWTRLVDTLRTHFPGMPLGRTPGALIAGVILNDRPNFFSADGASSGGALFFMGSAGLEVAVHELGHAAFALADEYQGSFTRYTPAPGEPDAPQPNVTIGTTRATTKWKHLIRRSVAVPTQPNPGCADAWCSRPVGPNPLGDDLAVGSFEGNGYHNCGLYRPSYRCKMRCNVGSFCRVCLEGALRVAIPAAPTPPDPGFEVSTTTVDFGVVAPGTTATRTFEVRNRRRTFPGFITCNVGDPAAPFAIEAGLERPFLVGAPIIDAVVGREVAVTFTAPASGTFEGQVTLTPTHDPAAAATVRLRATAGTARRLRTVDVGAPAVNFVFASDGTITVGQDFVRPVTLAGSSGSGFLQSRTFRGEPGAPAGSHHGYEYRIDLTGLSGGTLGITALGVPFGAFSEFAYATPSNPAPFDVFVVTQGGLGQVGLASVEAVGPDVVFTLTRPVRPGETTFFFGGANPGVPREATGFLVDTTGTRMPIAVHVPS